MYCNLYTVKKVLIMALDGIFLNIVKEELEPLIGGRVDKISQPAREEIIITFRTRGGNEKLFFSASAGSARVHITKKNIENPKTPPMFCMLMRKHIGNGRLLGIRQDGLERVLYFDFEAMNELGDMVTVTLAMEIMGRCSNLIMINSEGKIIDSIKRVDPEMSRERPVLPGMRYSCPPRGERLDFRSCTKEDIEKAAGGLHEGDLAKSAVKMFEGISPIVAREWVYYASRVGEPLVSELKGELLDRFYTSVSETAKRFEDCDFVFTAVKDKSGLPKDFSFIPIKQYEELMDTVTEPSACALLDFFYSERDSTARMKQRSQDLYRLLKSLSERTARRIANQREELLQCADRDKLKLRGDLLSAQLYSLEKGMTSVTVQNFYEENCPQLEIKLDPRLTPSQNMQRYYAEYRKADTAEKVLTEQIAKGEEELAYIESVFDALTRTESEDEALELRRELAEQGYIRAGKIKGKPPKSRPPLEFTSPDGFTVLVGRNNRQNDTLTTKLADKTDIWLHTKDIPGSHVIIRAGGMEVPDSTVLWAAQLAARYSKAAQSAQVPVDYVPVRLVKKPAGAKPGMVIFTGNRTVYVKPAENI